MGKSVTERAPSNAAVVSSNENMVSINNKSTPPSANALACSAKLAFTSSGSSGPYGLRIVPTGPIEPATSPPLIEAALRAISAARIFTSGVRS